MSDDSVLTRMEAHALLRKCQGRSPGSDRNYLTAMAKLVKVAEQHEGHALRLPTKSGDPR